MKLALLLSEAEALLADPNSDLAAWVHFYATKQSGLCLEIIAARQKNPSLLRFHQEQRERLAAHIERIQSGHPLVTSHHLKELGIAPGKLMGQLLKEAERIAIHHNLSDPDEVLRRLKLHSLWPSQNRC
jgi:poly(A) polymerase